MRLGVSVGAEPFNETAIGSVAFLGSAIVIRAESK
jgi:hypothetical protein